MQYTTSKSGKEWVGNGVNGLLISVADSEKVAEKILLLVNDYKLRRVLEKKAVETVKAKVNWQENILTLKGILNKMTGCHKA